MEVASSLSQNSQSLCLHPNFLTELSRQGPLQKSNYNHMELEWLARGAATLNSGLEFSCAIQAKMVANILQNSTRLGLSACAEDLQELQDWIEIKLTPYRGVPPPRPASSGIAHILLRGLQKGHPPECRAAPPTLPASLWTKPLVTTSSRR